MQINKQQRTLNRVDFIIHRCNKDNTEECLKVINELTDEELVILFREFDFRANYRFGEPLLFACMKYKRKLKLAIAQ